jgi:hypothetical protein
MVASGNGNDSTFNEFMVLIEALKFDSLVENNGVENASKSK